MRPLAIVLDLAVQNALDLAEAKANEMEEEYERQHDAIRKVVDLVATRVNVRRDYLRDDRTGEIAYYEGDKDWVLNNLDACIAFLRLKSDDPCS